MHTEKGFVGIPGLPDGWRLVRIGPVLPGEWRLMDDRSVMQWKHREPSLGWAVVLRKIGPNYRPFANASEADQFWNAALRFRNPHAGHEKSRFRINTIGCDGITVGLEFYSYGAAFDTFCVDDDGTPFGVKIDE